MSQGSSSAKEDTIGLDVHALNELQQVNVPPTDDSLKYNYTADDGGVYTFEQPTAKIIRIRYDKKFQESVQPGQECGLLLDRTSFYAEQGGQIFDEGFIVKEQSEDDEFKVKNVQVRGGYVLHVGTAEGVFTVGDTVKLYIDEPRRCAVMKNHTATHILNFALRDVLKETDQKGSLVAPDRLRFDFSAKGAMSVVDVKATEEIVNNMVKKNELVYAKETALAMAKSIQGLRAVFDEVYPDPVRVVSVGIPVEDLEADPTGSGGQVTTVEFCGGTHLKQSGHIGDFVITTEEAISKGVRRIIALTGSEAHKAVHKQELLQKSVNELTQKIEDNSQTQQFTEKELNKNIVALDDEVAQSGIAYWKRDSLRSELKALKKKMDDIDKARKAAVVSRVTEESKKMIEADPDKAYTVHVFDAGSNAKALDAAMKQYKALSPRTSAMFFSVDQEASKILCMSCVPKDAHPSGLNAKAWVDQVVPLIQGKGGGKELSAQATGTNTQALEEAVQVATDFAKLKLS
ncbi:alanine--tRNA ligase, cytoplasmic-like [Plakobranchus ocellatus]|uniref:alanine--tRNA ligase n=1 Tax=Plakobranchus ocellatus TaxID=259542 RepID=A0AAV4C1P5_9GAST|nr:alanine--tRNA ligase, cytoplasmic-like [Plakobranchus ocellatus]